MMNTSGFYHLTGDALEFAPNFVWLPSGEILSRDNPPAEPVGGWQWFDSIDAAYAAHDLPLPVPDWEWPTDPAPTRYQRWTAPDGSEWVYDQPRNELGQYAQDDPETEEVESAMRWLPVIP